MSDAGPATPHWLRVLLVLELLWWLAVGGLGVLFISTASSFGAPDAAKLTAALVLAQAACLACDAVLLVALFRKRPQPPGRRFGVLHGWLALIAAGPVAATFVGLAVGEAQGGQPSGVVGWLLITLALIGVPLAGLLLSQSDRPVAGKLGIGLAALSCPLVALLLFAVMISLAVAGGLTA